MCTRTCSSQLSGHLKHHVPADRSRSSYSHVNVQHAPISRPETSQENLQYFQGELINFGARHLHCQVRSPENPQGLQQRLLNFGAKHRHYRVSSSQDLENIQSLDLRYQELLKYNFDPTSKFYIRESTLRPHYQRISRPHLSTDNITNHPPHYADQFALPPLSHASLETIGDAKIEPPQPQAFCDVDITDSSPTIRQWSHIHRVNVEQRRRQRSPEIKMSGITKEDLAKRPSYLKKVTLEDLNESVRCVICMYEYELNDRLRVLPCAHEFHCGCIDMFLISNASCPICRSVVKLT